MARKLTVYDDDEIGVDPEVDIDWDAVRTLQDRYDAVQSIPDDSERLAAARALVAEMNGEL